ncbi:MAG: hypothetical protein K8823_629 [Cenarchaeum symbiont of Oopsacas minuta]|nr:hypothetical protein [Cenarchaeum symbiont of Oopsacas minuta]
MASQVVHPIAAQEAQFATYQEITQVVLNEYTGDILTSIALQSGVDDEIILPLDLVNLIAQNPGLNSLIVTSKIECIPGVGNESCLLINMNIDASWTGINSIHKEAREIGDSIIENANNAFGTIATFHSIYIHTESDLISGIANPGTITVAYTMPKESSNDMYEKISLLLADDIRNSGGFHSAALQFSKYPDTEASFAYVRIDNTTLMQMTVERVSVRDAADTIFPIALFGMDELKRSEYFNDGFYPLNSLIHVLIINSSLDIVSSPDQIPIVKNDGVAIPTNFEIPGWIVEQYDGIIDAKYLFGTEKIAHSSDVWISFASQDSNMGVIESDISSWWIILIIPIAGTIVLAYVLKKRR